MCSCGHDNVKIQNRQLLEQSVSFSRMTLLQLVVYNINFIVMIIIINPKKAKNKGKPAQNIFRYIEVNLCFLLTLFLTYICLWANGVWSVACVIMVPCIFRHNFCTRNSLLPECGMNPAWIIVWCIFRLWDCKIGLQLFSSTWPQSSVLEDHTVCSKTTYLFHLFWVMQHR
jgi:hypothetical protein